MQINKNIIYLFSIFCLFLIVFFINSVFSSSNKEVEAKLFTIEKGQTVKEIALNLKEEKLIKDQYSFIIYAAISGKYTRIQAGEYLLSSQMSASKIINIFTNGEINKEKLTIIEGWDLRDIAKYLEEKGITTEEEFYTITGNPTGENESAKVGNFNFLSDKPKNLSIEGYLFPDTYYIDKTDSIENIIDKMLKNFNEKISSDLKDEIKRQKKTMFEIITMASMIEKEVKTIEDKKIVSGILWKRMDDGMRLQVDATVLYAQGNENSKVYIRDTQIDSPYNTYRNDGLPLGPISSPGIDSIIAAVYPTKTDYYYYLSAPDGTTIWSKTFEEHTRNKAKYLK